MPILWNPTDEKLVGMHDGISYIFNPDDKKKIAGNAARHLLTHLETRGLTLLEYGDESLEEEKKKAAIARQKSFEMKQIRQYNLDNAKRARQNLPWVEPPKIVQHFAIKHNVKLEEFFSEADVKGEELSDTMKRANDAEKKVQELSINIDKLTKAVEDLLLDKIKNEELASLDGRTKAAKELKEKMQAMEKEKNASVQTGVEEE